MSIDKLLDRHDPEQQQNKIPGWLPGIVLDLDDPKKLGRIKVKCPLIDNDNPLPNNNDGWVQMLNGSIAGGGSNELIQLGDQIVLLPMMGDIRQCIGMGVLHSTQDPPSPHFDRSLGVYGRHSPSGDIEIKDEGNQRSIKTFNGNTEIIDAQGNRTIESSGGAKLTLGAAGSVRIDNPEGTMGLSADGQVSISNGEASLGIASSEVNFSILDLPSIRLSEFGTQISGQKDEVSRNMSLLKNAALPALSQFPIWSSQLRELAEQLTQELEFFDRLEVIYQIDEILEQSLPQLAGVSQASTPLVALSQFQALDIGIKLVGQIDQFREAKLTAVVERYREGIDDPGIEAIETELANLLDYKFPSSAALEQLQTTLRGLKHNPEEQLRAILTQIVPLAQIDGVISSQLHQDTQRLNLLVRKLEELELEEILAGIDSFAQEGAAQIESIIESLSRIAAPITPGATQKMVSNLKGITAQIRSGISRLKSNLEQATSSAQKITDLRNNTDLETEFGELALVNIKELLSCVESITPNYETAVNLEALTTALLAVNDLDEPEELSNLLSLLSPGTELPSTDSVESVVTEISTSILPAALIALVNSLSEGMTVGLTTIKALDSVISSNTTGGGMDITPAGVSSTSSSGATGGNVIQDQTLAALYGPGANRGVGAKVVAEGEGAILAAAGADAKLGGKVEAKPEQVTIKAPGAELGLGTWFEINQQNAYFYAPGGSNDLGSSFYLDQENLNFYAPGGQSGAGSSFNLTTEAIGLFAPGGSNGSSLVLNLDYASLYSPGGARKGGTRLRLAPDKLTLSYPGITGGNIVLSNNKINIDLPVLQNSVEINSTGITVKSMLAKVKVSQVAIDLTVGGSGIRILPGVILVNGVPLTPGGQLF